VLLGIPIAFVLAMVGCAGIMILDGWESVLYALGSYPISRVTTYSMIVVPLFIFMGELAVASGAAEDAYEMANRWLGRLRGGLVLVTLGTLGLIAATTGTGAGGTVAMGKIAVPEMKKYGYDTSLATGAVAAGGTIGAMIPPSLPLVIYGVATMTSVGALLMAGILPGILSVTIYMAMVYFRCWRNPDLAPQAQTFSWRERIISLRKGWGVLAIFTTVVVGLYGGFVTPMEVGAIGCLIGLVLWFIGMRQGRCDWKTLRNALVNTARMSAMIFALLIGGGLFSLFVVMTQSITPLMEFFVNLPFPPHITLLLVFLVYIPMGMFIDNISMILLAAPIIFPVVVHGFGMDPVWFGIVQLKMGELAAITPPMAMGIYVTKAVVPDVPLETIMRGCLWFMLMDLLTFGILFAFPVISTWLPSMMRM
jgi:tripartite ATP-independent transporter DctM subunit